MMFNSGYSGYPEPVAASNAPSYVSPHDFQSQYDQPPEKTAEQKAREEFEAVAPECFCKVKAKTYQVFKEGPNKGKWFYVCEKPKGSGACDFFKWAVGGTVVSGSASGGGVRNNALTDIIAANQARLLKELESMHKKLDSVLNFCNPNH